MSLTDEVFVEKELRAAGFHAFTVRTNADDSSKVDITLSRVDVDALLNGPQGARDDAYDEGYRDGADEAVAQGEADARDEIKRTLTSILSSVASGMETLADEVADLCRHYDVNQGLIDWVLPRAEDES